MLPFGSENIKELVEHWNKVMPIDRWYRKKYNIPFNSPTHRAVNIIDMFFEFLEFVEDIDKEKKNKQEPYNKGDGNFMKEITYTQKDIDDLFDEIDIDNMD